MDPRLSDNELVTRHVAEITLTSRVGVPSESQDTSSGDVKANFVYSN